MLKNARFETSATNDASTALEILPSQKSGTKLMDIVFSRRRRVEAGAFSDLKKHTTFTKTHSRHIFTIKKSCKLRNPPKSTLASIFGACGAPLCLPPLVYRFPLNTSGILQNRLSHLRNPPKSLKSPKVWTPPPHPRGGFDTNPQNHT